MAGDNYSTVEFKKVVEQELDLIAKRRDKLEEKYYIDEKPPKSRSIKAGTKLNEEKAKVERWDHQKHNRELIENVIVKNGSNDKNARECRDPATVYDLTGLALSGGGIRSSAFSIGALQALEATKIVANRVNGALNKNDKESPSLFEHIDYLSTVSGGGYTGCAVSDAMKGVEIKKNSNGFPLKARLEADEPELLVQIRNGSSYLLPTGTIGELTRTLSVYLRGVFSNLPLLGALLLFFVILTVLFHKTYDKLAKPDLFILKYFGSGWNWLTQFQTFLDSLGQITANFWITIFLTIAGFVYFVTWSLVRSFKYSGKREFGGYGAKAAGYFLIAIAIAGFVELQPYLIKAIFDSNYEENITVSNPLPAKDKEETQVDTAETNSQQLDAQSKTIDKDGTDNSEGKKVDQCSPSFFSVRCVVQKIGEFTTTLTTIGGLLAAGSAFLGKETSTDRATSSWSGYLRVLSKRIIFLLAGLALPLLLWVGYLYLCFWAILPNEHFYNLIPPHVPWLVTKFARMVDADQQVFWMYIIMFVPLLVMAFLQQPNKNSPHGLYRDRLGDTFLQPSNANGTLLSEIGAGYSPFHLINCALNIQGSRLNNPRSRGAELFTFSATHTGSHVTGYAKTSDIEEAMSDKKGKPSFGLGSAMAVSAAAASTAMGANTLRPMAFTLAALNVRLGYWFPNPRKLKKKMFEIERTPSLFVKEITGNLHENLDLIYLSDGGHIENLGLYTLLQRRCKFIIVVDGEADPDMEFPSFITLQRFARIDLGTRMEIAIEDIAKSTNATRGEYQTRTFGIGNLANQNEVAVADRVHCAIGTIHYPGEKEGILLYVKSSLSGDENQYVTDYAKRKRAFPHETTGDQFFSEEQFEVYRALGFHALHKVLIGEAPVATDKGNEYLVANANKQVPKSKAVKMFRQMYPIIEKLDG